MLLKKQIVYKFQFEIRFERKMRTDERLCINCKYDKRDEPRCLLPSKYGIDHKNLLCACDLLYKYDRRHKINKINKLEDVNYRYICC